MSDLHVVTKGDSGPRVAFCHGLFGQGRNWTQIAKALEDICRPALIDMPNHGRSAWTERFDYLESAGLVADTLVELGGDEPWILVGHSMGGKIAMLIALTRPELVERLVVVDISPASYGGHRDFQDFVAGMREMDLDAIKGRKDAEDAMAEAAPDPGVRAFLLQNLRRDGGSWRWQMNLEVLGDALSSLGGWPADEIAGRPPFEEPVLWIAGETSGYVQERNHEPMRELFPKARLLTVKNAGHWVHSEQPEIVVEALRRFIRPAT